MREIEWAPRIFALEVAARGALHSINERVDAMMEAGFYGRIAISQRKMGTRCALRWAALDISKCCQFWTMNLKWRSALTLETRYATLR
jgi:tRNA A37 N6-isopentenylltransferase MiaA